MEKHYLDLMQFFEGYVRNYRRMNMSGEHNRSMVTRREIEYFANLGEMLGFTAFVEDSKMDKLKGRSRPMDLSWWKWDVSVSQDEYAYLALHLERENLWNKDEDTIEKLFSETVEGFIPHNVIGIQNIESVDRIEFLNSIVKHKNVIQQSNVLMIYRSDDIERNLINVMAILFRPNGDELIKKAICKQDDLGYWFMCLEEEYELIVRKVENFVKTTHPTVSHQDIIKR